MTRLDIPPQTDTVSTTRKLATHGHNNPNQRADAVTARATSSARCSACSNAGCVVRAASHVRTSVAAALRVAPARQHAALARRRDDEETIDASTVYALSDFAAQRGRRVHPLQAVDEARLIAGLFCRVRPHVTARMQRLARRGGGGGRGGKSAASEQWKTAMRRGGGVGV